MSMLHPGGINRNSCDSYYIFITVKKTSSLSSRLKVSQDLDIINK